MSIWFYAGYKQYEEALYQNLIFSYAYFIYYNLFTVKTEIKSHQQIRAATKYGKFYTS
jgi:hypothetical protein